MSDETGRSHSSVQDERGSSDWGGALQKRLPLDPASLETVEVAAIEALAFLRPRR
jgi:hypothetical protein